MNSAGQYSVIIVRYNRRLMQRGRHNLYLIIIFAAVHDQSSTTAYDINYINPLVHELF